MAAFWSSITGVYRFLFQVGGKTGPNLKAVFTRGVADAIEVRNAVDGAYLNARGLDPAIADDFATKRYVDLGGGIQLADLGAVAFNDFSIGSIHVSYTATGVCTITIDSDQAAQVGRTLIIKDVGFNASTNNIIVETEGAELIEGQENLVINIDGGSVTLQSNGTDWFIV